jgi:hypothetical protein
VAGVRVVVRRAVSSTRPGPFPGGVGGRGAAQGLAVEPAVAAVVARVALAGGGVGDGSELLPDLRGVLGSAAWAQQLADDRVVADGAVFVAGDVGPAVAGEASAVTADGPGAAAVQVEGPGWRGGHWWPQPRQRW